MDTIASKSKPLKLYELVQIHDTNRYITDDYGISISLNETVNRYSVGINVVNAKIGVSSLSEYWHFPLDQRDKAIETYNEIVKRVKVAVHDIEYEEIPMGLIQPIIYKAIKDINNEDKERSGIFLVDVNKSEIGVETEADWRSSLYGHRYPDGKLSTMKSMWNKDEDSKSVVTDNVQSSRNRIVKYKKSNEEEEMAKFATTSKLAQFNYIRELLEKILRAKWPTVSTAAIMSFIPMFISMPGMTMELLADKAKNDPKSIIDMIPEVQPDYSYEHQGKIQGLQPEFRQKVEVVLNKLKQKGWQPTVAEGLRTKKEQTEKVKQHRSQTMDSKHLMGLAADIVDHRYGWGDKASDTKYQFWKDLGEIAKSEGLEWGGDWGFVDVAHIQIAKKETPEQPTVLNLSKTFTSALATTLEIEKGKGKGYVHDKHDRGGATNKGITLQTYLNWLKKHKLPTNRVTMKTIPDAHINSIYKEEYWDVIHGDQLPPLIAQQLFDFAVNSGNQRAIRTLQSMIDSKRTLARELKQKGEDKLASEIITSGIQTQLNNFPAKSVQVLQQIVGAAPDGKPGPKTVAALNKYLATGIKPDGIIGAKTIEAINNYVKQNGENQLANQLLQEREKYLKSLPEWKYFGDGWTDRLNTMESIIQGTGKKPMPKQRIRPGGIPERYTSDFRTPQSDIWDSKTKSASWQYEFPENNV